MIEVIICLDTISIDNLKTYNSKYDPSTVLWVYPESNRSPKQIVSLLEYIESDSSDHTIYTSSLFLVGLFDKKDVKWFFSENQVIFELNFTSAFEWFASKYGILNA